MDTEISGIKVFYTGEDTNPVGYPSFALQNNYQVEFARFLYTEIYYQASICYQAIPRYSTNAF